MPHRTKDTPWPPLIDRPVYADPLPFRSRYTRTTAIDALRQRGAITETEAANLWAGVDSPRESEADDGRTTDR